MKTIRILSLVAIIVTLISSEIFAADLPASLPLGSKAQLRAYAIDQVVGGSVCAFGETIMWSSTSCIYKSYQATGAGLPSANDIIDYLQKVQFNFNVTDPTKPVNIWATLQDKNGQSLFYGYGNVGISSWQGKYHLQDLGGVKLKLADYIPISLGKNVSYASIRDSSGNYQELNTQGGEAIWFPTASCGKVILIAQIQDGTSSYNVGYDLTNGGNIIPVYNVQGITTVWIDDLVTVDDRWFPTGTLNITCLGFQYEGSEPPAVSIKVSKTRQAHFAAVIYSSDGVTVAEYPLTGWLFKRGSETEKAIILKSGQWSSEETLDPGEWLFYPDTHIYDGQKSGTTTSTSGVKGG